MSNKFILWEGQCYKKLVGIQKGGCPDCSFSGEYACPYIGSNRSNKICYGDGETVYYFVRYSPVELLLEAILNG
jgi:hypothetical protein